MVLKFQVFSLKGGYISPSSWELEVAGASLHQHTTTMVLTVPSSLSHLSLGTVRTKCAHPAAAHRPAFNLGT